MNDERVTQREYLCAIADELGVPAPTRRMRPRLRRRPRPARPIRVRGHPAGGLACSAIPSGTPSRISTRAAWSSILTIPSDVR